MSVLNRSVKSVAHVAEDFRKSVRIYYKIQIQLKMPWVTNEIAVDCNTAVKVAESRLHGQYSKLEGVAACSRKFRLMHQQVGAEA